MSALDVFDVIIVGSGAGAAPLALRLGQTGFRTLILEKGPRYERSDFTHDELFMAFHPNFFVPSVETDPHVVVYSGDGPTRRVTSSLGWISSCVGGGTVQMGGALYRFQPCDFRLKTESGTFEEIADWPYTYEELERYYGIAESEVGVSGAAGTNPFEGVRSTPYPMPPLDRHALATRLSSVFEHLGMHPFPTPRAINSIPYHDRPSCEYCQFCAGYGCPIGARGSMPEALLGRAEATGHVEIRSRSMVRRINVNAEQRATGCVYMDEAGLEHRVTAQVVCVCCSAVESARLLLLSRSSAFPAGLANNCGLVGRFLQFHSTSLGRARFELCDIAATAAGHRRTFLGCSLMDHYVLPPETLGTISKGGVHKFELDRRQPVRIGHGLATEQGQLTWGIGLKQALRASFNEFHTVKLEIYHDYLPNSHTYVELDPDTHDRWGLQVAKIHIRESPHHFEAGTWLLDKGLELLDAAGGSCLKRDAVGRINPVMVHGTCRFGHDPQTSVLNQYCQAHEVRNLFVVDGSFMPTSGGSPSTLTILANSFRTADYIIANARTGRICH